MQPVAGTNTRFLLVCNIVPSCCDFHRVNYITVKDTLVKLLPLISTIVFILPALTITLRRLWSVTFFKMFGIYGLMGAALTSLDMSTIDPLIIERVGLIYNMIDIPYVMLMIFIISKNELVKRVIILSVVLYIFLQLVFYFREGMNYAAIKISLGYGLSIVLLAVIFTLLNFFRRMGLTSRQVAYIVILSALMFDYGTFIVIYIFDYYVTGYNITDNLVIYYISSIIAMTIGTVGLWVPNRSSELNPRVNSDYSRI